MAQESQKILFLIMGTWGGVSCPGLNFWGLRGGEEATAAPMAFISKQASWHKQRNFLFRRK
jgi:hypothetical protein